MFHWLKAPFSKEPTSTSSGPVCLYINSDLVCSNQYQGLETYSQYYHTINKYNSFWIGISSKCHEGQVQVCEIDLGFISNVDYSDNGCFVNPGTNGILHGGAD